ncbi:uncharacterized protein [Amphiura filiformis]|uniref:uncharacterized protein n=1 Tax=Amphiura filiformis TaxID=82378 RepID=UPI003B20CC7C
MVTSAIIVGILCQIFLVFGQPTVRVEQGKILGETVRFENDYLDIQKDIDVFLGIPYAEPPVGERRFKAPLPKEPWSEDEVYNATYTRDICVQTTEDPFPMSEDCLHLNVYAPNPKHSNASVMVFIHGGGYSAGNGYFGSYSGIPLSSVGDVIIVTLNYRLSAFGYLTTGDEASPGNYGMLDQVEALRWVKTNIQAFGGDPNRITIFGESAGAGSVSAHLLSPLSRDLFNQAILQSGSILAPWSFNADLDKERDVAFKLGEAVGCSVTTTQELISCMRKVEAQVINAAAVELEYEAPSAPCVDNNFLVELPLTSIENNNFKDCPLINGFTKYLQLRIWSPVSEQLNGALFADDPEADYFDAWNSYAGDAGFACPATIETRAKAMAGEHDIYQYYFTHVPSINFGESEYTGAGWLGAGHAEELAFVFGYPFYPPEDFESRLYLEEEMSLSKHMMKYWTNFAKTGNPNKESVESLPYDDNRAWPAYTFPDLKYKDIAVNLTTGRGVRAHGCHFWNDYLKQLITFAADLKETEKWRNAFDEYECITLLYRTDISIALKLILESRIDHRTTRFCYRLIRTYRFIIISQTATVYSGFALHYNKMTTFIIIIVSILCQMLPIFGQPIVTVEQGQILGDTVHFENEYLGVQKDIDVFLGIPYAEPPVGDRRFRASLPKEPWSEGEIYNATYNRDICMQTTTEPFTISEDCLHLNVYAPNPKPVEAAVMVFIHGGGYAAGNGYFGVYSGVPLSSVGDIIVVTINYRLMAFGFLTTGDEASPGNYGLLDQVEALRWIKTNIQAFGGDPNKITIFGESAGASSVSAHLISPLSRDLFNQAILESGSILAPWAFNEDLEKERDSAFKLGEAVGCPATTTQQLISCMREVDAQVINAAANELLNEAPPAPCVDNNFLVELPLNLIENNNFKKCPLINGFNKDEGTAYILGTESGLQYLNSLTSPNVSKTTFDKELEAFLTKFDIYRNDLVEDSIRQEYVDWSVADDPETDYFDAWNYYVGDASFACPATMETRAHVIAEEHDVYQYYFTHVPSISVFKSEYFDPKWLGAGHGEEIAYVFGYPFYPPENFESVEYPREEMSLSQQVMQYWTNFAQTGNPNKESEASRPYNDDRAWPAYTFPNLEYKDIAVNLTSGRGVRADECHFWNDYLKQLTTFSADLKEIERQWREEFYTWKYTDLKEWRDAFDEYETRVGSKNMLSSRDEL